MRYLLLALFAAVVFSLSVRAQEGAELSADPILRIENGQHVGWTTRIATDAANRFAVTASDDKTVRVWSLPEGRQLRVLRLPLDLGDIGKAYAVAMSPDAGTVAVGGWTGPGAGHDNIFLFDRATGELKQRLTDLPNVIHHLAFSPDGRRLVTSLGGANGIRIYDVSAAYRPLPSDMHYGDSSYWAQFDAKGRLLTTSSDGLVRLYENDRYDKPIASFKMTNGSPFAAAFSPDGARVAVGDYDRPEVLVLSGSDLKQLFKANTSLIPDVGLQAVGWSQDGRYLFAGGYWQAHNVEHVRRWSDNGRGSYVDIPVAPQTIMELLPLKSGDMLFAHGNGFGLIKPDAKVIQLQGLGALDLANGKSLRVSVDARKVQVDAWEPRHTYRFSFSARQIDVDPADDKTLRGPFREAPELSVTGCDNRGAPTSPPAVNGVPLKLEPSEWARSCAVVPGTQHFVLGADWSLRLFDQQGHELWPAPQRVPDTAWRVNVAADSRLIVAAFGDGTIRWRRVSDGQELLALFIHPMANDGSPGRHRATTTRPSGRTT